MRAKILLHNVATFCRVGGHKLAGTPLPHPATKTTGRFLNKRRLFGSGRFIDGIRASALTSILNGRTALSLLLWVLCRRCICLYSSERILFLDPLTPSENTFEHCVSSRGNNGYGGDYSRSFLFDHSDKRPALVTTTFGVKPRLNCD